MNLMARRMKSTLHGMTQQQFKETMGRMANQAMILSSACNKGVPPVGYRGLTLSSVSSLALMPQPMVQFNLQVPSFTSESLHRHNHFAIHLLKPNQYSIELARIFSKGAIRSFDNKFSPTKPFVDLKRDHDYKMLEIPNTDMVIPVLENSERVLICQKKEVFRVGDHEIWVGNVKDILVNDNSSTGGLLYYNRHFHKLGNLIEN